MSVPDYSGLCRACVLALDEIVGATTVGSGAGRSYLVDGIQFGGHHVLAALGVDMDGNKRVLGIREEASENAVVALGLLESLVERGQDSGRARLFFLDGSKALRVAVSRVVGSACLVQRCRNHKMRNDDQARAGPGRPGSWTRRKVGRGSSSSRPTWRRGIRTRRGA